MTYSSSDFMSRFQSALYLTGVHILSLIGYTILSFVIVIIGTFTNSLVLAFLFVLIGYLSFIVGFYAAIIFTLSHSKYFACRLDFFQAYMTVLKFIGQLLVISIVFLVVNYIIIQISYLLGLILGVLFIVASPLISFYFVMEWIFANKENPNLSTDRNHEYIQYQQTRPNFSGYQAPTQSGVSYVQSSPPHSYGNQSYGVQPSQSMPSYPTQQPSTQSTQPMQPVEKQPTQEQPQDQPTQEQPAKDLDAQPATEITLYCNDCGTKAVITDKFASKFCGTCGNKLN